MCHEFCWRQSRGEREREGGIGEGGGLFFLFSFFEIIFFYLGCSVPLVHRSCTKVHCHERALYFESKGFLFCIFSAKNSDFFLDRAGERESVFLLHLPFDLTVIFVKEVIEHFFFCDNCLAKVVGEEMKTYLSCARIFLV